MNEEQPTPDDLMTALRLISRYAVRSGYALGLLMGLRWNVCDKCRVAVDKAIQDLQTHHAGDDE